MIIKSDHRRFFYVMVIELTGKSVFASRLTSFACFLHIKVHNHKRGTENTDQTSVLKSYYGFQNWIGGDGNFWGLRKE